MQLHRELLMRVKNSDFRTIWCDQNNSIKIIDQTFLPFELVIKEIITPEDAAESILNMRVRGAPLIGITAAFGVYLAARLSNDIEYIRKEANKLILTRPTAINLKWAVDQMLQLLVSCDKSEREQVSLNYAKSLAEEDILISKRIGKFGLKIIDKIYKTKKKTVNILTHCNAGWLAAVDVGTATAPIYEARDKKIPIHVWVDETRPRNQGASLTSWELINENIDHTVVVDNAGGHLMQNDLVDLVITGSDRTTFTGDVCNKIGTYLKALAANANNVPFYVALPTSTIDWNISKGEDIEIEERSENEVHFMRGTNSNSNTENFRITLPNAKAANYAFDVTPKELVTGLITEHGIIKPNEFEISKLKNK